MKRNFGYALLAALVVHAALLCAGEARIELKGRSVFYRLEPEAKIILEVVNSGKTELPAGTMTVSADGLGSLFPFHARLPPISAGGGHRVEVPVPVVVQPGGYLFSVEANWNTGSDPLVARYRKTVSIVEKNDEAMPVVMWGTGKLTELKRIGFTHQLYSLNPASGVERQIQGLDAHLRYGIGALDRAGIGPLTRQYPRLDRNGVSYARPNLDAANPEAVAILRAKAGKVAECFGSHPAFAGAMIHTEVRDKTNPSFSGFEQEAYRKFSGVEVPTEVNSRWSLGYQSIPGLPDFRVVPDHHPLLTYYRWFWKIGDGWNPLHGSVSRGYHDALPAGRGFWSFHDPVVRVPPVWGGGGEVDAISHWTYSYPDPLKMGQVTDELLAMGDGRPGQMLMKMTQAIWYRSQVAPGNDIADKPQWAVDKPDAPFISIAPDNLREAFWLKIARRLDGIMYHGYPSLVEETSHKSYFLTNTESREVLAELVRDVIVPLGALLKTIPEPPPRMAILESFATSIFAPKQHSFGWGGSWSALLHQALQWAHYQPAILYEEHIRRGDLDNVEVLILAGCEVLPQSTFDTIRKFQERGGIVVGDEFLVPGILPDISVRSFSYDYSRPDRSKEQLQKLGMEIRRQLEPFFTSSASADTQDMILRMRSYGTADYLFAINDRRTFGDYVGQWGKVMEKGLPCRGAVSVPKPVQAAYDLVKHCPVPLSPGPNGVMFELELAPGDGKLIMLAAKPIGSLLIDAPGTVTAGKEFHYSIRITDTDGQPFAALVPVELTLTDRQGRKLLAERFPVVKDGIFEGRMTLSVNLKTDKVRLNVRCLASGRTASCDIAAVSP
jgi:hypothetical protein